MRHLAPALALTTAALVAATPAAAQSTPGASASGYAWGDFQIGCTTCPHHLINLTGEPVQSSEDPVLAQVQYNGVPGAQDPVFSNYTLGGGVSYAALATFEGVLWTPVLKAKASADNIPAYLIADPDVPIGIDLYQATADAGTRMLYQYTGSAPASYTFHFEVDGLIGNQQASVFASAGIYGGPALDQETGVLDFGYADVQGAGIQNPNLLQPFLRTFSVTAEVDAGSSFWLLANLGVLASMTYSSADVVVNAYDTLRVTGITGGDTALLVAMPVPEPTPAWLLAAGLAVLALRRRQRP